MHEKAQIWKQYGLHLEQLHKTKHCLINSFKKWYFLESQHKHLNTSENHSIVFLKNDAKEKAFYDRVKEPKTV